MMTPTLYTSAGPGSPASNGRSVEAHHGLVGLVLISVIILFLLDRAGFRFMVSAGKR